MARPLRIVRRWLLAVLGTTVVGGMALGAAPLGAADAAPSVPPAGAVDFQRDIQPILARHCLDCHGPKKYESGLRLDTPAGLRAGGYSGPLFVAGQSAESLLVLAVTGSDDASPMPPEGRPRLSAGEVDLLRRWIDAGATLPAGPAVASGPSATGAAVPAHWSFQPVQRPTPPAVRAEGWVRTPIDRFILARLEAEGIAPSPEADRVTLIRRLSFDLLGLPPTPEEVDDFVADDRPDAYARLVERLLASPHYGERWGRHWLDAARYGDSNGYTIDGARSIWKYRDWVIEAVNADLPFDEFAVRQVAGDMLPEATEADRVATGFHRNTLRNEEGGTDPEQFRIEAVADRVHTIGTVFLGLSVGCARCHDHKYDPLTQREYYQFFALLNNCDEPTLSLPTDQQAAELPAVDAEIAAVQKRIADVDANQVGRQAEWERRLLASIERLEREGTDLELLGYLGGLRDQLRVPASKRTAEQAERLAATFREQDPERAPLMRSLVQLESQRKQLQSNVTTTLVVRERPTPRETRIHIRGDFTRPGAAVEPGVPASLPPLEPAGPRPTRLDLARWLVDPRQPLTPRVTVNRVWQQYFGIGLVTTENDFGVQGDRPTHPELLDWLAAELVAPSAADAPPSASPPRPWSLKHLHRLIVSSAVYRQASAARPELAARDANNRWLARQNRLRLEAESIRDAALFAAGLLAPQVGGPSVYPPQPTEMYRFTQQKKYWPDTTGPQRYRRGLYTFLWRSSPYPFLTTFDAPDGTVACTRRNRSNTPLQALTLANDPVFVELARALAARVLRETPAGSDAAASDAARLRRLFRLALAREPAAGERDVLMKLLAAERRAAAGSRASAQAPATDGPGAAAPASDAVPTTADPAREELAAWFAVARAVINVDEFITRE